MYKFLNLRDILYIQFAYTTLALLPPYIPYYTQLIQCCLVIFKTLFIIIINYADYSYLVHLHRWKWRFARAKNTARLGRQQRWTRKFGFRLSFVFYIAYEPLMFLCCHFDINYKLSYEYFCIMLNFISITLN